MKKIDTYQLDSVDDKFGDQTRFTDSLFTLSLISGVVS